MGTESLPKRGLLRIFVNMKTVARIAYWILATALIAAILLSLEYTVPQALLIGLVFCPCAIALEYLLPKATSFRDKVYLSLALLTTTVLLLFLVHHLLWGPLMRGKTIQVIDVKPLLVNPIFLGAIMTLMALGDEKWHKWLDRRFIDKPRTLTFFSDRKTVTLDVAQIAYIESNDTEVRVVTREGQSFRNKTGIGQWENLLGVGFVRIHRSYLVNAAAATFTSDSVTVGGKQLPVSRKYREPLRKMLNPTSL
jgi:hypothetical protein